MSSDEQHTDAMAKPGYEPLWGKGVDRIIDEGLQIVQMKTVVMTQAFAERFYEEHVGGVFSNA
jgi:nucleoside-diphosphate kinase